MACLLAQTQYAVLCAVLYAVLQDTPTGYSYRILLQDIPTGYSYTLTDWTENIAGFHLAGEL